MKTTPEKDFTPSPALVGAMDSGDASQFRQALARWLPVLGQAPTDLKQHELDALLFRVCRQAAQPEGAEAPDMARALLEAGANPNQVAHFHGHAAPMAALQAVAQASTQSSAQVSSLLAVLAQGGADLSPVKERLEQSSSHSRLLDRVAQLMAENPAPSSRPASPRP